MKALRVLFFVAAMVAVVSCSKDIESGEAATIQGAQMSIVSGLYDGEAIVGEPVVYRFSAPSTVARVEIKLMAGAGGGFARKSTGEGFATGQRYQLDNGEELIFTPDKAGVLSPKMWVYAVGGTKSEWLSATGLTVLATPKFSIKMTSTSEMVKHLSSPIKVELNTLFEGDSYTIRRSFPDSLGLLTLDGEPWRGELFGALPKDGEVKRFDFATEPQVEFVPAHSCDTLSMLFDVESSRGVKKQLTLRVHVRRPSFDARMELPQDIVAGVPVTSTLHITPEWSEDTFSGVVTFPIADGILTIGGRKMYSGEAFEAAATTAIRWQPLVTGAAPVSIAIRSSEAVGKTLEYSYSAAQNPLVISAPTLSDNSYTLRCFDSRTVAFDVPIADAELKIDMQELGYMFDGVNFTTGKVGGLPTLADILSVRRKASGEAVAVGQWQDYTSAEELIFTAEMCYDALLSIQVRDKHTGRLSQPLFVRAHTTPAGGTKGKVLCMADIYGSTPHLDGTVDGPLTIQHGGQHTGVEFYIEPQHAYASKVKRYWYHVTMSPRLQADWEESKKRPDFDAYCENPTGWCAVSSMHYNIPADVVQGYPGVVFWKKLTSAFYTEHLPCVYTDPMEAYLWFHFRDDYGWGCSMKVWVRENYTPAAEKWKPYTQVENYKKPYLMDPSAKDGAIVFWDELN